MTKVRCSICEQDYEMSDFESKHLPSQHNITGPVARYLAFLEKKIKALEEDKKSETEKKVIQD